jgi:hypothetical protein
MPQMGLKHVVLLFEWVKILCLISSLIGKVFAHSSSLLLEPGVPSSGNSLLIQCMVPFKHTLLSLSTHQGSCCKVH